MHAPSRQYNSPKERRLAQRCRCGRGGLATGTKGETRWEAEQGKQVREGPATYAAAARVGALGRKSSKEVQVSPISRRTTLGALGPRLISRAPIVRKQWLLPWIFAMAVLVEQSCIPHVVRDMPHRDRTTQRAKNLQGCVHIPSDSPAKRGRQAGFVGCMPESLPDGLASTWR